MCFNKESAKKVLITGSSGFVGSFLLLFLRKEGYLVQPFTKESCEEGCYAVIHLAGESLSKGCWTKKKKEEILRSRVEGTEELTRFLSKLQNPPKVFISASAVGYYGDSEKQLTEESNAGSGFLATVCQKWEKAALFLEKAEVRVVLARFGYILSSRGGMLKALLPIFRLGLGGKMGSGLQFVPWVALEDVARSFCHILTEESVNGPVNIVSPNPVTQEYFAKTLAHFVKRPAFFAIPKWMLLGEKAKSLLLPSLKVLPVKLQKTGFVFRFSTLEKVLEFNL